MNVTVLFFYNGIVGVVLAQTESSYEDDYDSIDHNDEQFEPIYNMLVEVYNSHTRKDHSLDVLPCIWMEDGITTRIITRG